MESRAAKATTPTSSAGSRAQALTLANRLPGAEWRTRFAPAPTGYLHLGHLVNAIYVWGIARAFGGRVLLRVEDHDRTRCRPEYERSLLEDLDWLGFEPDEGSTASYMTRHMSGDVTPHPFRQSDNRSRYANALATLDAQGLVYACTCTRRDIADAVGHTPGEETRYPGTCRDRSTALDTFARRVRLDEREERFDDLRLGPITQVPSEQCGDVLARDRHGSWTYQFAVSVDDMQQEVDVVIRGEDLVASTGRQLSLARMLGRARAPQYLHHPLLLRPDGTKLSKAAHDTSLRERRARGASAESLIGEAAFLAGLTRAQVEIRGSEVVSLFR